MVVNRSFQEDKTTASESEGDPRNAQQEEMSPTTEPGATGSAGAARTAAPPSSVFNMTDLPPAWDLESDDLEKSWEDFKAEFEFFADISQLDEQTDRVRRAALAKSIGAKGRAWCRAIEVDFKTMTIEEIFERIEKRIESTTSQTLRDFNFWHGDLKQKAREPFDSFLARIIEAAAKCDFKDTEGEMSVSDRLIRSRIIIGITDAKFQENLLSRDLSLRIDQEMSSEGSRPGRRQSDGDSFGGDGSAESGR